MRHRERRGTRTGNNLDWYLERRGGNADHTFIITQGLAPDAITAKYGAPRDVLHCDAFEVFLHGKDLDAPMRAGFTAETAERDGTRAGPP
ncbi:hypothetical protein [Myxococcus xanthus]|uniref:hypothetical protein n=1 Tax=Myxococcus xanthus TaxID=34 RepID=UPI00112C2FF9|nr:hypothetical protein [Myxococcus xanthus]QDE85551.1 hypothetical protein BHS07_30700 [Myxococcus xanthus]